MLKVHNKELYDVLVPSTPKESSFGEDAGSVRSGWRTGTPRSTDSLSAMEEESGILSTRLIDARFDGTTYDPKRVLPHKSGGAKKTNATSQRRNNKTVGALELMVEQEEERLRRLLEENAKAISAKKTREYLNLYEDERKRKEHAENRKRELLQAGRAMVKRQVDARERKVLNRIKQQVANEALEEICKERVMKQLNHYEKEALGHIRQRAKQRMQAQDRYADHSVYRKLKHEAAMRKTLDLERKKRFEIEQKLKEEQARMDHLVQRRAALREMYQKQKYLLEQEKYAIESSKPYPARRIPVSDQTSEWSWEEDLDDFDDTSLEDDAELYEGMEGGTSYDRPNYDTGRPPAPTLPRGQRTAVPSSHLTNSSEILSFGSYAGNPPHQQPQHSSSQNSISSMHVPMPSSHMQRPQQPFETPGHMPSSHMQRPQQPFETPGHQSNSHMQRAQPFETPGHLSSSHMQQPQLFDPRHVRPAGVSVRMAGFGQDTQWFYVDASNIIQGPFPQDRMRVWNERGLFPPDLLVQPHEPHPDRFMPITAIYGDPSLAFH